MHASTPRPDGQRAAQNPIRVDILAEWAGSRCMAPEDEGQTRQGTARLRRHRPAQEDRPAVPPRARSETRKPDAVRQGIDTDKVALPSDDVRADWQENTTAGHMCRCRVNGDRAKRCGVAPA
ncbi:hypothetical protein ERJ75_000550300 [Trypanosoma vivax]|nr:hypothetical protein ERJ75_000550300 [Trypanosoma vivax]